MTASIVLDPLCLVSCGMKSLGALSFCCRIFFFAKPVSTFARYALVDKVNIVYYVVHMTFGKFIREQREVLKAKDSRFSVRKVAQRIGVEPAYLSKIERGEVAPPSELKIRALAKELDQDPDVLLAMAGKVSSDLLEIIRKRPQLFADLIRQLKSMPDNAILRIARDVRDGDW